MQSFSTHRTQPRIIIALVAVLALIMGVLVAVNAPKAHAAEVQPTVANLELTDAAGNPVDTVTNFGAYQLKFDFAIADAEPGDTFVVTLPEGFRGVGADVALGDIANATRLNDNQILVTFTDAVAGMENLTGGFAYLLKYDEVLEDGAPVSTEATIGNEAVYIPDTGYGTDPGRSPMVVNKWSGTNLDGVNSFETVKLSRDYGYALVAPVPGQTFAKWFVDLNNWNTEDVADAGELGDNIVVTDTLQGLGDFTPQLRQVPSDDVSRVLTQDELNSVFAGPYVKSRQDGESGRSTVEVRVRDQNGRIALLNADVDEDAEFLTITENADGSTTMQLLLSDFLDAQYPNLSEADQATLDDPRAQYAMAYVAVLPEQSAAIYNEASFTSTNYPDPGSDKGSFTFVSAEGWGEGEFKAQPTTRVEVNKTWEGLAEGEEAPVVTFNLLANGEPAVDLDQNPVEPITFEPGTTAGAWEGLLTQLEKGEPITYTVVEEALEGWETTYSPEYLVDLTAVDATGVLEVTNTKVPEENPEPTEPTEPTDEPTPSTVTTTVTTTVPCDCVPTTVKETSVEPAPSTTSTVVETSTAVATETPTVTVTETVTTTPSNPDEQGEPEPSETPTPVDGDSSEGSADGSSDQSSGSSGGDLVNRCVNNAIASPLLWLVPVGLIAGVGGKALAPYAGQFQSAFADLTSRLGMGGRYDRAFEELSRSVTGGRGVVGFDDPFREQRRQAEEFVGQLGQNSSGVNFGPGVPGVDVAEIGRVVGPIAAIVFAGLVAAYWCTTPVGETFGAQLSS